MALLKIIGFPMKCLWLLADPKGFLQATTSEAERSEMGIKFDD